MKNMFTKEENLNKDMQATSAIIDTTSALVSTVGNTVTSDLSKREKALVGDPNKKGMAKAIDNMKGTMAKKEAEETVAEAEKLFDHTKDDLSGSSFEDIAEWGNLNALNAELLELMGKMTGKEAVGHIQTGLESAAEMAKAGMQIGSAASPIGAAWGALAGAVTGAAVGFGAMFARNKNAETINRGILAANARATLAEKTMAEKEQNAYVAVQAKKNAKAALLAEGGNLDTMLQDDFTPLFYAGNVNPLGITEFNTGGTHEENIIGGIPQGINVNGKINKVELGEVKYNDYIYSNRLFIPKEIKKLLSISKNNTTFAEAVKTIKKEAEESPYDSIVLNTLKNQLQLLKTSQESIKQNNNMDTMQQQMPVGQLGGQPSGMELLQQISQQDPQVAEAIVQVLQQQGIDPRQATAQDIQQAILIIELSMAQLQGATRQMPQGEVPAETGQNISPMEQEALMAQAGQMAYGGNLFAPGGQLQVSREQQLRDAYRQELERRYLEKLRREQLERSFLEYLRQNNAKG